MKPSDSHAESAIRLMPMGRHTQRIDSMECRESVPYRATRNPEATNGSVRQLDCKSKVIEIDEDNDDENGGKYAKDFRTFLLTHPELVRLELISQLRRHGYMRISIPARTVRSTARSFSSSD